MANTAVDTKQNFSNPIWIRCHRLLTNSPTPLRGRRLKLVQSIIDEIESNPRCIIDHRRLQSLDSLFRQIFH